MNKEFTNNETAPVEGVEKFRRLSDTANVEQILLECLRIMSTTPDFETAINRFLEYVGRYYRAERSYIIEFDHAAGTLSNTFEWCAPGVVSALEMLQDLPLDVVDDWVAKFEESGEFCISSVHEDLASDARDREILQAQNITALMAAPLYRKGKMVGFIGVDDPEAHFGEVELLQATTDFVIEELNKRRLLQELEQLSFGDALTGVYNRNCYIKHLEEHYTDVPESLGIVIADINSLKAVNDVYGHRFGDEIIKKTAEILRGNVPYPVYRIGGDEFIVPCPGISKDEFAELEKQLRRAFAGEPNCDISLGFSWNSGELDIDEEINRADELMYAEKQHYYHDALNEGRFSKATAASELLREISEGSFVVYYQPQMNIFTGEMIGAEALVRRIGSDGALVPPPRFIPYYEAQGVIMHLDFFVLSTAISTVKRLQAIGVNIPISVNFSRLSLMTPAFAKTIREMCDSEGVDPKYITIEVTETISKMGREPLSKLLSEIRAEGFGLSLDDFGSQYSNISMLTESSFSEIKFDKTLVDSIETGDRGSIILSNLIHLCRELSGVNIIAEGIETKAQVDKLREYACRFGQGYYFHKPMSFDALMDVLKK